MRFLDGAEGEGFEPSRDGTAPNGFRDLTHLAQPCALRPGARHNAPQSCASGFALDWAFLDQEVGRTRRLGAVDVGRRPAVAIVRVARSAGSPTGVWLGDRRESAPVPPAMVTLSGQTTFQWLDGIAFFATRSRLSNPRSWPCSSSDVPAQAGCARLRQRPRMPT
jgi:hypothetical protein